MMTLPHRGNMTRALLLAGLALQASTAFAASPADTALAAIRAQFGGEHAIVAQIDLAQAFATRSPWTFVVAKQTDRVAEWEDPNPLAYCFVHAGTADCEQKRLMPLQDPLRDLIATEGRPFYEHRQARIVHMPAPTREPLLFVQACTQPSGDGDCGIYTFVWSYDRAADRFQLVLRDLGVERNRNGVTRFIEQGPLAGLVASANATNDAPYAYWISVFRRGSDGIFRQVLRYRSRTRYGDGDRRSVIDSDMEEMTKRMAQ